MKMLRGPFWARLGILMLLYMSGMAPLHLVEEVHAVMPATAQHHQVLHNLNEHRNAQAFCDKLQHNASKPLSSTEHERHHKAECAADGMFDRVQTSEVVKTAPIHWHISLVEYVPAPTFMLPDMSASDLRSRPPPQRHSAPTSPLYSPQLGRAPPVMV